MNFEAGAFDADKILHGNWRRGFWRISAFAWHLTHFLCMAFDADWNRWHLTHFLCMAFDADWNRRHLTLFLHGIWRRLILHVNWRRFMSMAIDAEYFFFKIFFEFFFSKFKKKIQNFFQNFFLKSFWKLTFFQHFLGCSKSE